MARIQKRSGNYRVRWYDHEGRRRSKTFTTERDARVYGKQQDLERDRIRAGLAPPPCKARTFRELAEYHKDHVFPDHRAQGTYRSIVRVHLMPAFGESDLVDIREESIDAFRNRLRGKSAKTTKNILALLKSMLRKAKRMGWIYSVPHFTMPKVVEPELNFLGTPEEFNALMDAAKEERPGISELYATALYSGMRAGELAGLRRFDVDMKRRRIRVARAYDGVPTKNGRIRWVPILDPLQPIMTNWLATNPNPVLFPNEAGTSVGKGARVFDEVYHRCLERAGLPRYRFHDLRHSFAAA